MVRFVTAGTLLIFLISLLGECERANDRIARQSGGDYVFEKNLGKAPPSKKTTRTVRFRSPNRGPDYLTKDEFYDGMEDAEMKGMEHDPSAEDIYNEFNR